MDILSMLTAALQRVSEAPRLIVVMGVSGCGKSTIAEALALAKSVPFHDADNYHPAANIAKMSRGEPLNDDDRWPWLRLFGIGIAQAAQGNGVVIGACSALRQCYREAISTAAGEPVLFVHLTGSKTLIQQRLQARKSHFMPSSLLDSQFATLEPPQSDELILTVSIDQPVDAIIGQVMSQLERLGAKSITT